MTGKTVASSGDTLFNSRASSGDTLFNSLEISKVSPDTGLSNDDLTRGGVKHRDSPDVIK